MLTINDTVCTFCYGQLSHYDKVDRYIKGSYGQKCRITLNRSKCKQCGKIHRILPGFVMPYKQYRKDIILRVINGNITCDKIGFEDYPCEMTMSRWKKEKPLMG